MLPGFAVAVEPQLVADEMREFPGIQEPLFERTVAVDDRASTITVLYSSSTPLQMRVSFPFATEDGGISYNPLFTLRYLGLPSGEMQKAVLSLTQSPAWDPWRERHLLHIFGPDGASIQIHSIERTEPTTTDAIVAAGRHLLIGEPVLLSSINYLWGYRALGINLSVILGILLILFVALFLMRSTKSQIPSTKQFFLIMAFFLLLYDARFSLDLLKVSAKDLSEWLERKEYRQLGPTLKIVDRLKEERATFANEMKIGVCFPWDDIYLKQIRYHLYPSIVKRMRDIDDATHVVFLGAKPLQKEDGSIACDDGERSFRAEELVTFGEGNAIYQIQSP